MDTVSNKSKWTFRRTELNLECRKYLSTTCHCFNYTIDVITLFRCVMFRVSNKVEPFPVTIRDFNLFFVYPIDCQFNEDGFIRSLILLFFRFRRSPRHIAFGVLIFSQATYRFLNGERTGREVEGDEGQWRVFNNFLEGGPKLLNRM